MPGTKWNNHDHRDHRPALGRCRRPRHHLAHHVRRDHLVARALEAHGALIADETLARELAVRALEAADGEAVRWDLGDGRALAAALSPA